MSTPLTDEHIKWRRRVFIATWLSYVGFYFCRKPFSAAKSAIGAQNGWDTETLGNIWAAYLIAYSIGAFLASRVGTWLGPRKNLLIGMALSVIVTLIMGIAPSWQLMAGLVFVNGLAQATGWSGNVGTMANWFHKHERGRVMGAWSTNFTTGSLLSGFVMAALLGSVPATIAPWEHCFYVGACVLGVVWIQFYFLQRNKPEDLGLAPVDDPVTAVDESKLVEPSGPLTLSREAWTNLLLVAGFYFFAKFIRYAVWSWSAYFLERTYELKGDAANQYATIFDICGLAGVYMTGYLSDRFFKSRRAGVSLIFMIGMMAVTGLLVLFGGTSVTVFTILLGGVGFFLYGPDALLSGAGAMDIGSRRAAVFATGVIAGFGAMGPVVQELVIARMYDGKTYFAFEPERWLTWLDSLPQYHYWFTGQGVFMKLEANLGPVFQLLFGSATLAALFCAALVMRNRAGGKGI
jgi:OPA family sugar phosphate sensor protein UhpC-like MFS transporter